MSTKTVLITGSNSGLGFEAARLLASKREWTRIVLGARTEEKARTARDRIVATTGRNTDDFRFLLMDLVEPASVAAALVDADAQDLRFDAIILNAGGMVAGEGGKLTRAASGESHMFAMNVGGHVRLVHGLLAADRIQPGATLIFAGSEASRGIPMMMVKAAAMPKGKPDLDAALWAVATGQHDNQGDDMSEYGLAKQLGTAWMQELAHRHGDRLQALTVSPGMTLGTNIMAGAPAPMKLMMSWIALPIMKLTGQAHDVQSGAARYLTALEDGARDTPALHNGGFYASPGGGVTGALTLQTAGRQPLLADDAFIRAVGRMMDRIASSGTARSDTAQQDAARPKLKTA